MKTPTAIETAALLWSVVRWADATDCGPMELKDRAEARKWLRQLYNVRLHILNDAPLFESSSKARVTPSISVLYPVGTKVWYTDPNGAQLPCKVVAIHGDQMIVESDELEPLQVLPFQLSLREEN